MVPKHPPFRREGFVPERHRNDDIHAVHDSRTLAYDAVRLANGTDVIITGPEPRNFGPMLRDGPRVDGEPARRLRRRLKGECERVRPPVPEGAKLGMRFAGREAELPVRASETEAFRGRRVVATMSSNNDLEWISAWARYHARARGADAVALHDSNSDDYGLDELEDALASTPGIAVCRVIGTPFPHGGGLTFGGETVWFGALQKSILNISRRDMGAAARAVLNRDIDELVISKTGRSVFDAARSTWRRAVRIRGSYVFPESPDMTPLPQYDHTRGADPNMPCSSKWCARPAGFFARVEGWSDIHQFGGE